MGVYQEFWFYLSGVERGQASVGLHRSVNCGVSCKWRMSDMSGFSLQISKHKVAETLLLLFFLKYLRFDFGLFKLVNLDFIECVSLLAVDSSYFCNQILI